MTALVDESHRLRKKVAVHCHGDQAAREAIEAGVDSIEHGSFMKPETLTLVKHKGTFLTPTLMAAEYIMSKIDSYPLAFQAKARAATTAQLEMFRNAVKDRGENFLWDGRRGFSAWSECERIQVNGGSWDDADRRAQIGHVN